MDLSHVPCAQGVYEAVLERPQLNSGGKQHESGKVGSVYVTLLSATYHAPRSAVSLARPSLRPDCYAFRRTSSLTWGENGPEPEDDVAVRRGGVVPNRRPTVERVVEPTAAPKHTDGA